MPRGSIRSRCPVALALSERQLALLCAWRRAAPRPTTAVAAVPNVADDPLLDPQVWPTAGPTLERVETHISRLYFTGARVYKLKKPVRLPFLDYSSLEQRKHCCEEELRLGRRLAPQTYLRVAPLRRDARGKLRLDGEGELCDWVVEMERLPAQRMLDALLERGELDNQRIGVVARFVADFHRDAERGPHIARWGAPEVVARNARDNLDALSEHAAGRGVDALSERALEFLRTRLELARLAPLIERRAAGGRVCDGHGDLHSGNICLVESGVVAYDCVEFSPALRCADVASDLGFLCMDLDLRGYRAFAEVLAREYAAIAGDGELAELLEFYKAYRALVRAKVGVIRASQATDDAARAADRATAQSFIHLALAYALPPPLIVTCGLPAGERSWLARRLAAPFEAAQLASDVRREFLAQSPRAQAESEACEAGPCSPTLEERTYESLLETTRELLRGSEHRRRRSVVVDATFSTRASRTPLRALARELRTPFVLVHVRAGEQLTGRRTQARETDRGRSSASDWGAHLCAEPSFEPPDELEASERMEHTSGVDSAEDTVRAMLDRVIQQVAPSPQPGA